MDENDDAADDRRAWLTWLGRIARWVGGVLCFACYSYVTWIMWPLPGGFLLFPIAYLFGVATVWLLPVPPVLVLSVGAAWLMNYSVFDALDVLISLLMLYAVPWVARRGVGGDLRWTVHTVLAVAVGQLIWLDSASYPLAELAGRSYTRFEDLELLQTVDIAENFAVFTVVFAVLSVCSYGWLRFERAGQEEDDEGTRRVRRARSVTRGLMFAMLGSAAESFRAPWHVVIVFVLWPVVLELRDRGVERRLSRLDQSLSRVRSRVRRAGDTSFARILRTLGRALITTPGLLVIAAVVLLAPSPRSSGRSEQPVAAFPASTESSLCIDKVVSLTEGYGLNPDSSGRRELEAEKLKVNGQLTAEQYDFVVRLREVAKYRFYSAPYVDGVDQGWGYQYLRRLASLRCNQWYPSKGGGG